MNIYETVINGENNNNKYSFLPDDTVDFKYLHRWFDSFPFNVADELIMVSSDGKVSSWLESEEVKEGAKLHNEMYNKGLIPKDILNMPGEEYVKQGSGGLTIITTDEQLDWWPSIKKENPNAIMEDFLTAPEKPMIRTLAYTNSNAISATTKNPEAGVMFFDWLYAKAENYELFAYGIENTHWKNVGEQLKETINPDENNYGIPEFAFSNGKYKRNTTDIHPTALNLLNETVDGVNFADTINFITLGFVFNPEPVSAEFSNCQAEIKSSFIPIAFGVLSYEDGYEAALKKLKAAGIDKVILEYEKQLNEFLSSK